MNWKNLFHIHIWSTTRMNPFGIVTEQGCRCGKFRHHTFKDTHLVRFGDLVPWKNGRHPQELKGKTPL